jgi:hypothetical protein
MRTWISFAFEVDGVWAAPRSGHAARVSTFFMFFRIFSGAEFDRPQGGGYSGIIEGSEENEDSILVGYRSLLFPSFASVNLFNLHKAHLRVKLASCHLIISDFHQKRCAGLRRWDLSNQRRSSSALSLLYLEAKI